MLRLLGRRGYARTLLGALIVLAYLFPVYWMAATSLKTRGDVLAVPPDIVPTPPVIGSYLQAVINDPSLHRAILNSVVISTGTVISTVLLACPAAYALARLRLRITAAVVLILLISQLLPTISLAVPLFVIFSGIGLIDTYPALILVNTIFTLPFAIIVLRPFFLSVPKQLEDAAKVDGCTQFRAFYRVVLPLIVPGLVTVGAIAFLMAWGEFVFGLTLTTSERMQPVTVALNRFIGQYGTRWNDLMAVSTTIALPIVVIFASMQRYIVSGLTAGATKE
ncbi:MAG: ABC transporter permease subunit [Actinobacteria bacterium]|nr:ABC transporter permease subunit [Actinomycetota bacterium]